MYQPLPQDAPQELHSLLHAKVLNAAEDGLRDATDASELAASRASKVLVKEPLIYFTLCLALTAANVIFAATSDLSRPLSAFTTSVQTVTFEQLQDLRRPSQYIRFDEIERPNPPVHKQFNNYPLLVNQVDEAYDDRIFGDESLLNETELGVIARTDKLVIITSTISTVMQFRAIDYGMERCELRVSANALPPADIEVYRLNATKFVNPATLSYHTRPPRLERVGVVHTGDERTPTWQYIFSCATEEALLFELACTDSPDNVGTRSCELEWRQGREYPGGPDMYIVQHSTV